MAKRGIAAITVCSHEFVGLGQAQARALGHANLPIAVVPHPFGSRTRDEVRRIAEQCIEDLVRLVGEATPQPVQG